MTTTTNIVDQIDVRNWRHPDEAWVRAGDCVFECWVQPYGGTLYLMVYGAHWEVGRRGTPLDTEFVGKRPLTADELTHVRQWLADNETNNIRIMSSRIHRMREWAGSTE